mgnify:CR=1 FL=1
MCIRDRWCDGYVNKTGDGEKIREFVEEVLKQTGVSFVPGWGFGRTGKKAIRISFGPLVEDVQKIEKGLARVEKYLKNE